MKKFEPDYTHVIDAAYNREAKRLPLYEPGFAAGVIEKIMGSEVWPLLNGYLADRTEAYRRICQFVLLFTCTKISSDSHDIVIWMNDRRGAILCKQTFFLFGSDV
jgi:hypothetical protein